MKTPVLAALGALVVLWSLPLAAQKGDAKAGKATFESKCVSCHGPGGEGKESVAKMFGVEMKPLASKEVQGKTDDEIRKTITEGKGKMKAVQGLSDKDAGNVIAFVRSLGKS